MTLNDDAKATTAVNAVTTIRNAIAALRLGRLTIVPSGGPGVLGGPSIEHPDRTLGKTGAGGPLVVVFPASRGLPLITPPPFYRRFAYSR